MLETADPVEEIATRSKVLTRASVLALVGCAVLILAAVLWTLFGRAPDTIVGEGVIVPATGFAEAGTRVEGVVDGVNVAPGDMVARGQVLVSVRKNDQLFEVRSPIAGQAVYVFARDGRPTRLGQPLVILQPDSTKVAQALMPAEQAELITPGMLAWVSPSSAPRSQYGFIVGKVLSVAPAPVTREQLLSNVGDNSALVDHLLASGPVQEVTVSLNQANTPSGYEWTIGEGPDAQITSSTLSEVAVVKEDKPILAWLLP